MALADTVYSAPLIVTTVQIALGRCLIRDPANLTSGEYVIADAANRAASGRKTEGIAVSYGDASNRAVEMRCVGPLGASITQLAAGGRAWLRVSATGWLERVASPSSFDDVVGFCEANGDAFIAFGWPWELIINGSPSGGTTPSGTGFRHVTANVEDATVTAINLPTAHTTGVLSVAKGGTGLSALGTALQLLRTNAAATLMEWWTLVVDLATSTVTGVLPYTKGGTGLGALGTAYQALRTNAAANATEWASLSQGSADEIQTRGANAGTFTAAANVKAGSGYVSIGASPASAGSLRFPADVGSAIAFRDHAGAADMTALATYFAVGSEFGDIDGLIIGGKADLTGAFPAVVIQALNLIEWHAGPTLATVMYTIDGQAVVTNGANFALSPDAELATPTYGGGVGVVFMADATAVPTSNPTAGAVLYSAAGIVKSRDTAGFIHHHGAGDGQADIDCSAGNVTLTPEQRACPIWYFHGSVVERTITVPNPAGDPSCIDRLIVNKNTVNGDLVITTDGPGTPGQALVAINKFSRVYVSRSGVFATQADYTIA